MHRFLIGACAIALAISLAFIAAAFPAGKASIVLAASQCIVYFALIGFAWACRKHFPASTIVTLASLVAAIMGLLLIVALQPDPGASGPAILLILYVAFAQLATSILGGYIGYAVAQRSADKASGFNSIRGKLAVLSLFAAPLVVLVFSYVFVTHLLR